VKRAGSDLRETVLAIEGDGSLVFGMDAEEKAGGMLLAGAGDGKLHHAASGSGAVKFGEEIDASELEVARLHEADGEVGRGKHRVADGCGSGGDLGEPGAGLRFFEVGQIGGREVVLRAVCEKGVAGDETSEGFEQGGCRDDGERGRIGGGAFAQREGGCESHGVRISQGIRRRREERPEYV
jgi:hypothetical protein